eukprot:TRINITY_DN2190_c1_g2_i1.p1 TRINITY_DN2190_c1_g2~~TRINITY_DN2190_c1_g2_i1.p1  ORF type:complete len:189 (-),score=40.34 TRINITY_DN2190_c1_g2_i1:43-609(-)
MLGIGSSHVVVVSDARLPDSQGVWWDTHVVAAHVKEHVERVGADCILTFDSGGVSGHPNHISVFRGVREYAREHTGTPGYSLDTTSIIRKYSGPLDSLLVPLLYHASAWVWLRGGGALRVRASAGVRAGLQAPPLPPPYLVHVAGGPWEAGRRCWGCMRQHASQFVWYRKLFVVASRYTYVNVLHRIL